MGNMCVSSCRCCVFVSVVHQVAILSAVFCVICSLLMFLSDTSGDHMVETYSSMGLVMALYVAMIVSFCFLHVVVCVYCWCCIPTPMTLASGGSSMFPLVVHQPASPSIWPAVQSLQRGLSTNPGVTMWCVCGCS